MPKSPVCRQDAVLPRKRHRQTRTHYFPYFSVFQGSYVGLNQPPSQEVPSLPRVVPPLLPSASARQGKAPHWVLRESTLGWIRLAVTAGRHREGH